MKGKGKRMMTKSSVEMNCATSGMIISVMFLSIVEKI